MRILVLKLSLPLLQLSVASAASQHQSRECLIKMLFLMGNPTPHFNRLQKEFFISLSAETLLYNVCLS